ncbi:MAG: hypothetical protein CVU95_08455 [Firmicutes bacterium HGW-Firmicutes-2]|nr:MAG: hypothetical protein CVU95_08455 [Firmicutes bacterium HGW-Firmicutes-2]
MKKRISKENSIRMKKIEELTKLDLSNEKETIFIRVIQPRRLDISAPSHKCLMGHREELEHQIQIKKAACAIKKLELL